MLRASQGYASPMVEGVDVNILIVGKVHRGVPITAKLMAEEGDAFFRVALREPREAHPCARGMVVVNGVFLRVVGYARRASTVGHSSVWHMEGVRGVLLRSAQRVPVAALIAVCAMVGGSDATLRGAIRAHRGRQISAKPMVGVNGAHGPQAVTSSQGEGVDSVRLMVR